MINKINVKNFKSFKELDLSLTKLNLLTGLNGAGKSSLIQSLLLLRQSFQSNIEKNTGLILQGDLINVGSGKDAFHQYAAKDEYLELILYDNKKNIYSWIFEYRPETDILPAKKKPIIDNLSNLSIFNKNFQYLNAEHIPPQIIYQKSAYNVLQNRNIGIKGEYSVHYLTEYGSKDKITCDNLRHPNAKSESLIHQTDAWLSEISPGIKLIAEEGIDQLRLAVKFETADGYTNEFKPVNIGFGISYVLPVLLAILKAEEGDILLLENPESHLHPKGQSTIGKLIACAAQNGVQIVAETHSDHIINGIRVAVRQQKISAKNISIFYFERDITTTNQESKVSTIKIDRNGELSDYPKGFLDEWNEQLMELI